MIDCVESQGPIRVLQFTDSHLLADPDGRFLGLRPAQTLDAVIRLALAQRGSPDLVLYTGDLTQDSSPEAYSRVRTRMLELGVPVGLIPGNHDHPVTLARVLTGARLQVGGHLTPGGWLIVLLDSTILREVGGTLSQPTLDGLDALLQAHAERHTLVCLHHQPVPVGCDWMDRLGLNNGPDLLAVVERHPQVRGILWGHVHQTFEQERGSIRLISTPSTCVQFKPNCVDFAIDPIPPGYRWLHLHGDGRIETGVERLKKVPEGLDLNSIGY